MSLHSDTAVQVDAVVSMVRTLRHRGPDDEGMYVHPARRVALGMRRLAIIDLVSGNQPVFNEDRSVICVFNGEIYNFQELRLELDRRGHLFRSMSDTEVLVHLYEDEGVRCVSRLRGMFAFAIWDQRNELLFLARDRFGKKPLYYAEMERRFSFASEITALYGLRGLTRELDQVALDLYLTHSYIPAPHSIYRAIRKLPPAHYMLVRDGVAETVNYWRLSAWSPWSAPRREIIQTLQSKLEDAVKIRMVSDVPLGCFLSGGTDSSSVVALMSRISDKPVKTFSIGFTYERFNELEYARAVASQYRTEHHEHVVQADAVAVLPDMVRHFGEPYGDSSALPMWYVSKLAREHVTVALNGDGGDELFAGYPWYKTGLTLDRMARLVPNWTAKALSAMSPRFGKRVHRLTKRLQMTPGERFASLRRTLSSDVRQRLYSKDFLAASRSLAECYLMEHYEMGDDGPLARMQYTDMMTYLPEDLLVKVDRMTMAHSLEGRSPLLDHELWEFCARIPPELKIGPEGAKLIFREAVQNLFPPRFLDRPKMGFSVPLADWLRRELKEVCYRRVCGAALLDQGWFDEQYVRTMLNEHAEGTRDWSAVIWNLLVLAQWTEILGS